MFISFVEKAFKNVWRSKQLMEILEKARIAYKNEIIIKVLCVHEIEVIRFRNSQTKVNVKGKKE